MSKRLWKYCKAYGPVVIWAGTIYLLSSQSSVPGVGFGLSNYVSKKLFHMFAYALLYFFFYRGVNYEKTGVKNWVAPFLLTLVYASTDEVHQVFTPTRTPSPADVMFDMIGASIAFLRIYGYI